MKKRTDPRHLKRIKLVQALFAWDFQANFKKQKVPKETGEILKHLKKIDKLIASSASQRPLSEINKIDLAILRLAVFELIIGPRLHRRHVSRYDIIEKDTPFKVIIDESIELGKEYGGESSPAFINGALGKLVEKEKIE